MRWIVTFLDAIVLAYSLYGIVVWKNVFPEYIHSEYAEKFSENGLDVALFVNVAPYIQFLKPPDCLYDVFIKKMGDLSYHKLIGGYFGRGAFGTDGCSKGNMDIPRVSVFRTKSGSNVVGVYREEQYHYNEATFDLFLESNKTDRYVLVLRPTPKIKNSSDDTTYTDDDLLPLYLDNRTKVDCELYAFDRGNHYDIQKSKKTPKAKS